MIANGDCCKALPRAFAAAAIAVVSSIILGVLLLAILLPKHDQLVVHAENCPRGFTAISSAHASCVSKHDIRANNENSSTGPANDVHMRRIVVARNDSYLKAVNRYARHNYNNLIRLRFQAEKQAAHRIAITLTRKAR
jgi:hypothetical protein